MASSRRERSLDRHPAVECLRRRLARSVGDDGHRARGHELFGRGADEELDHARFDHVLEIARVEPELPDRYVERDAVRCTGRKLYTDEALQLEHRSRHRGNWIPYVDLDDFV